MLTAAKRKYGMEREIEAHFNPDEGEVELFQFRTVVEDVEDETTQIDVPSAHELDPDAEIGDSIGEKLDTSQFGRIAAQTAKQVIIQKVRDAEQDIVYGEYKERMGELITGIVRRIEKGNIIIDLGRTEAIVPYREQVPSESYRSGERLQGFCVNVEPVSRGPQVVLSRKDTGLLIKLFEMEVPEIAEKIVEIKEAAREPGGRSKIAVYSRDSDVDPVGACVGMKGSRVQSVVQELRGEKIDIVNWDGDSAQFVCNAIAPAEVVKVIINEKAHTMEVVVPDDQLSLAIGKRGQNVRLAAELAGWNIDVYSEQKLEETAKRAKKLLVRAIGIEDSMATILYSHAFRTPEEIAEAPADQIGKIPGISQERIQEIVGKAQAYMERKKEAAEEGRDLDGELMAEIEAELKALEMPALPVSTVAEKSAAEDETTTTGEEKATGEETPAAEVTEEKATEPAADETSADETSADEKSADEKSADEKSAEETSKEDESTKTPDESKDEA